MKTKPTYGNLPERCLTGTVVKIGQHVVELVRHGKDIDFDCPCYKLRHADGVIGNSIYTVDDLNIMGAQLNEI
jgi:hypothetical protein